MNSPENPLESDWFFQLVERSGRTPRERLLAVFNVAEQWITAPGIREYLATAYAQPDPALRSCVHLKSFLSRLAASAGAERPDVLAGQLVILLQGAIAEELRNPELKAIAEAARAATAIVGPTGMHRGRTALLTTGGVAATVFAAFFGWQMLKPEPARLPQQNIILAATPTTAMPAGISPTEMESLLILQERIASGACPAPQLLALPPEQMTAYMNAINFRQPENPQAERRNIRAFLTWYQLTRSTECYYRPHNGHTNITWTKS